MNDSKWNVSEEEREKYIKALTGLLSTLRAKANISQDELSALIGVSRQTYSSVERGVREMSWITFLALVMFYDYNVETHDMLRASEAFPTEVFRRFNETNIGYDSDEGVSHLLGENAKEILGRLDPQALNSLKNFIMVEYSRCTETPMDVVMHAFEGVDFMQVRENDKAERMMRPIHRSRSRMKR